MKETWTGMGKAPLAVMGDLVQMEGSKNIYLRTTDNFVCVHSYGITKVGSTQSLNMIDRYSIYHGTVTMEN